MNDIEFSVLVEKQATNTGIVKIRLPIGSTEEQAIAEIQGRINRGELQTCDNAVTWDGYEYDRNTFKTTGDCA